MDPGSVTTDSGGHLRAFVHPAVFYRTTPEYLSATVPFIMAGQAADEPVAVAVPGPNLTAVQDALIDQGGSVDDVRWFDMADAGRNPGRIIPGVLRAFADRHAGRRVRIIGEPVWAGRGPAEYPACAQYEALLNTAFGDRNATILCPYDAERLSPVALADAKVTHPLYVDSGRWSTSDGYAPDHIVRTYNEPLTTPRDAEEFVITAPGLSRLRRWGSAVAAAAGLDADRQADIAFVITEIATNSIEHGSGDARLYGWCTDTDLIVQAGNAGRLADPLAGRRPVPADSPRGRGLLSVNLLADLVRLHTDDDSTTVRAYFRLPRRG